METRRLFSQDPTTGVTKWFHYDDDTDMVRIETTQNVEGLVEASRESYNTYTSQSRWGDGDKVGNIPMSVYSKWCAEGKLGDQATVRTWLNDPANRAFRTRPGRV